MRAPWLLMLLAFVSWESGCLGLVLPERLKTEEKSADTQGGGTEEGQGPCKRDFVEQFFRLLSGPVGKEAEAVVAAALKLLQENDRVNLAALLRPPSKSRNSGSSSGKGRHLSLTSASKREMQFNPSGWRRKRDVSSLEELFGSDDVSGVSDANLVVREPRNSESSVGALDKRAWDSDRRRMIQMFQDGFKLKRKPLEFNPSGW